MRSFDPSASSGRRSAATRSRLRLAGLMLACIPALPLACGGAAEEAAPAPDPVEVVALGLRFARLPAGFSVAENGSRLVLEGDGTMTVEAGERSDFGLDPVTDANAQQARFESLDGGEFLGVQKLIVPIGPAAYARGRFRRDGEAVEETTVFVVHPTANRMVRASYSYPAVEDAEASRQRVQQLFELVGEMETSGSGGTDEADAASDPSTEP